MTSITTNPRWRPWINALRRHAGQPASGPNYQDAIVEAHETGVIWLPWRWSTRDDQVGETWPLAFEALELLAIAAHADQTEWRQLMTQWCPHAALYWENSSPARVFELGCVVRVAMTDILSPACGRFVRDDIASVVSDDYKQLRADLEATIKATADLPPSKTVARVRVVLDNGEFNARTETPEELSPLLFEVVQLVALQFAQENAPLPYSRTLPPLFRIEQVRAEAFYSYHTPNDLQYLHRIASCGVEVHTLQLNKVVLTQATAPQYTTMLQRMLAAGVSEASSTCSPSTSVWLHRDATSQTYDGVFSAVLRSTSVREFEQLMPDETLREGGPARTPARDRYWQWIAAAIFSSQATNPIDDVYFNFLEIEMEDANVFERTMQARNPLSDLFAGCTNGNTSVSASRFRLSGDVNDGDPTSNLTLTTPVNCLQIFDTTEDREWLRVLLPGWGQAWVKKADATIVGNSQHGKASREAFDLLSGSEWIYPTRITRRS